MTSYQYDTIDGQRVEKNVAKAFRKWAAAFKKETGETMHVRSGTRTKAEQQKGRNDYLAGRTSVKWADPYESSHCEVGPSGPRALDLYDSGDDYGLTRKGTHRHNVAVRLGAKYGFTWGGWGVPESEGWHFENHKVKVGIYGAVAAVVDKVASKLAQPKAMLKWNWAGIADMLRVHYDYVGNDVPGPNMIRAFQRFLNAHGYGARAIGRRLAEDGVIGKNTVKGAQQWLKEKWNYGAKIDAHPGSGTHAAWQRAERANDAAF